MDNLLHAALIKLLHLLAELGVVDYAYGVQFFSVHAALNI